MAKAGYGLTGDWNRLRSFLKGGSDLVDLVNEVLEEEANKIRDAIESEIPYGEPNADYTVRRKGADRPLEESGEYKEDGIIVKEYSSRDKGFKKYFIIQGNKDKLVESGGRDHNGINYADLLEIMENGSETAGKSHSVHIPARPVVRITYDRLKSSLESDIVAKTRSAIHEAIR